MSGRPGAIAKSKVFFDTNILVYQFNRVEIAKQKVAEDLVEQHISSEQAVISTQVVQEFMNVALKKFDTQIPAHELRLALQDLLLPLCVHFPSAEYYERVLDLYSANSISFYDAMIVQAALDLDCAVLYSEDLQDGQKFGKLEVVNPFKNK